MLTLTAAIIVMTVNVLFILGLLRILMFITPVSITKHERIVNTRPYFWILMIWFFKLALILASLDTVHNEMTMIGYFYCLKEVLVIAVLSYYIKINLTHKSLIKIPFNTANKFILW